MHDIFFISDTYFGHKNILKFTDERGNLIRPGFTDVDHMDRFMIDKWNATITAESKVYHCGDVSFDTKRFHDTMHSLNGVDTV